MLRLSIGLMLCIMAGSVNDASPLYMILLLGIPGLALMACNKHRYSPVNKTKLEPVNLGIKRYDNRGNSSKIIS